MCYSARVRQKFNELAAEFAAEVDWDSFEEIYKRRAEGENIKVSRDLQRNFQNRQTDVQKRTQDYIARYVNAPTRQMGARCICAMCTKTRCATVIKTSRANCEHGSAFTNRYALAAIRVTTA